MNSKAITTALYNYYLKSNKYCVQNIYFFDDCGEEDFLVVKHNGYTYSFEIKISRSDYKADFKKAKRHSIFEKGFITFDYRHYREGGGKLHEIGEKIPRKRPNRFFYVYPQDLLKVKEAPFLHKVKFFNFAEEKLKTEEKLCNKFYYAYLELKKIIINPT